MQGGIHPDLTLEEYGRWLRLAKEVAPQLHLHAYSPMEVHFMCERSGRGPDEVFEYLIECGLGSTPGTAAEVLDDGAVALIEWGDMVAPVLPADFLEVRLERGERDEDRDVQIRAVGPSWAARMDPIARAVGRWKVDASC